MNWSNLRTCEIKEMEFNPSNLLLSGSHYHTQHSLELTNLLNGYDADGQTENRERWALALNAWEDGDFWVSTWDLETVFEWSWHNWTYEDGNKKQEFDRETWLAGLFRLVVGAEAELCGVDAAGRSARTRWKSGAFQAWKRTWQKASKTWNR